MCMKLPLICFCLHCQNLDEPESDSDNDSGVELESEINTNIVFDYVQHKSEIKKCEKCKKS